MIDKTIPGKVSTHNNNRTKRIYQQQPSVASFRGPTENKKKPLCFVMKFWTVQNVMISGIIFMVIAISQDFQKSCCKVEELIESLSLWLYENYK